MWNKQIKIFIFIFTSIYAIYWLNNLWISEKGDLLNWLVFSHRSYLKFVEQEAYVMTKARLADFLSKTENKPRQLTKNELKNELKDGEDLYLLLKLQNKPEGAPTVWGRVLVSVNGKEQPPIQISSFHYKEEYLPIWIVPLNPEIVLSNNSPEVPKTKISWLNIYNK
jgi:hypothetical protein